MLRVALGSALQIGPVGKYDPHAGGWGETVAVNAHLLAKMCRGVGKFVIYCLSSVSLWLEL